MQTAINEPAGGVNRLAAVKRIYLYVVAFVSLAAMLASADSLLGFLSRAWLGDIVILSPRAVASSAGLLLVATPIFLLHWGLAQRGHQTPEERDSVLRKLFLYLASTLSLIFLAINVYAIVDGSIAIILGADVNSNDLKVAWPQWVLFGMANAALIGYWANILRTDGDFGMEHGAGRDVRHGYTLLAGLIGVILILWGGASLINVLLTIAVDRWASNIANGSAWWAASVSAACAQLLVGSWIAWANRAQWREVVKIHPAEGQAASRRIYLYIAIVLGAIATLTPAALVLREGLLMIFGTGTGELIDLLRRMISPLSFLPVGLGIWIWHSRVLHHEAEAFGESEQSASVRRLYFYLVAATGLALTWVGAVELLNAVLDWVISNGDRVWTEPLANGLSLIAVGAPVWALHWRAVQRIARQPDLQGADERGALIRRIYLFGIALVGALVILFELAQVVYQLLLVLMGEPNVTLFSAETARSLADVLVAAAFWGVHLLAIRGDAQLDRAMPKPEPAPEATTPIAGTIEEQRTALVARIASLEAALAEARSALQGLDDSGQEQNI